MPHIYLLTVGKLKKGSFFDLKEEYVKRIKWPLQIKELESRQTNSQIINKDENEKILAALEKDAFIIILDEGGTPLKSKNFATKIQNLENDGKSKIQFVIGGAEGLSKAVKEQADMIISFGQATWPHMMVRVMLLEQIYRAQQILAGHPYHKE